MEKFIKGFKLKNTFLILFLIETHEIHETLTKILCEIKVINIIMSQVNVNRK